MTVEQLEAFSNTKPELRYLTEEIIKYLGANPPGSPGGSSYLSATVTLTDAQIKALPTTPIEIIAAQGEGKAILVINGILKFTNIADYGNVGANALILQGNSTPFNLKQLKFEYVGLADSEPITYSITTPSGDSNYATPNMFDNIGIAIASQNTGDFTDGDSGNTLKVTVYYVVVDL